MAYGGADLSTYDPNPSMDDFASAQPGADWSSVLNTAGQWGATIASIVSGNQTTSAYNPNTGSYQTIGVAGSGVVYNPASQNSRLLILGVIVVAVVLLVRK
jgi:hypothetical protein